MAFITLAGTLRDPTSELAVGDQIRFTHKSTTGETIEGAVSVLTIDPSGTYSKDLQYGLVLVEYKDARTSQFKNLGVATVNGSNPATSIPELLNALVPVSSAELIEFQVILADAVTARNEAEAFANSIDLINDLSQAYIFNTVAEYKTSSIVFPVGKTVHLNDRDTDFLVITGTGAGNNTNIIASATIPQSVKLIESGVVEVENYGALPGIDSTAAIIDALSVNGKALIKASSTAYTVTSNVTGLFGYGVAIFNGAGSVDYTNVLDEPLYNSGSRNAINYDGAQTVYINASEMVMGGFRFRGQYLNTNARSFPTPSFKNVVSLISDLGSETTKATNNWYAVFAVANEGDSTCSFKLMPFIHTGSAISAGRFRTLEGGDNTYAAEDVAQLKGYDWGVGVDGSDCLAITEAGFFSGRKTTITGNGTTSGSNSLTVADGGAITKLDWLLPAPKGFEFYRYCGSFYNDSSEVRNIADDGYFIGSRGTTLNQVASTGAVTKQELTPYGNISPLASSVRVISKANFSTSSIGVYSETYDTDSSDHTVAKFQRVKSSTGTEVIEENGIDVPFSLFPSYHFSCGGSIAVSRTGGQHSLFGYHES